MKNLISIFSILAALAAAPNVVWLRYSTVRVTNEADALLRDVALLIDTESVPVGNVLLKSSRFSFLPTEFGEATLTIAYRIKGASVSGCQEYVESTRYHVEVVVNEDQSVSCSVEQPIFSGLLVQKLF